MKRVGAAKPGTNRSGTKRKHVLGSESGGSTADGMGTGSNSMDRPPDQQQAGSVSLEGDQQRSTEQEQLEMEKDGDRTGSEGEEDSVIEDKYEDNPDTGKNKEVIFLRPTNFDSAHMPRST